MGKIGVPFEEADELYDKLDISKNSEGGFELCRSSSSDEEAKTTLPSYPRTLLNDDGIDQFLTLEITTPDLNKFHPYLWLCGTQSSSHVTPISEQAVRGRTIVLTENPEFHLLWIRDRIYLKPIPKILLSHAFWDLYLGTKGSLLSAEAKVEFGNAARGFLRSYGYLIRHKADFIVAQQKGLIPRNIRFSKFVTFITNFESTEKSDVSLRYSYGELRLGRLNFWAWKALGRPNFHRTVRHHGDFVAQFYGPILFIFGVFSIVLSAMQVALASEQTLFGPGSWKFFTDVCQIFSILTLVVVLFVVCILIITICVRIGRELCFALRRRYGRGKQDGEYINSWRKEW